jgi:Domain of unknown function (DUF4398)
MAMRVLSRRALERRATTMWFLATALVAGCAAPADHPALDQAGAAVERARSAPRVRALAAAELDRAEVALERARAAARAGASPDQVEHLAYVVSQRAALAEAHAAERIARAEIGQLQRALGPGFAHGRRPRARQMDAPLGEERTQRASAQQDQQAGAPPRQDGRQALFPQKDQQTPAPLQEDRPGRALVREAQQADAPLEEDQTEGALAQQDQEAGAPLDEHQQTLAPLQREQQVGAPPRQDRRQRPSPHESQRAGAPLEEHQQIPAALQEERPGGTSAHAAQEAGTALEEGKQGPDPLQGDRQAGVPWQEARSEHALEDGRRARAPLAQERQARAALAEEQRTATPKQAAAAAIVETVPREITLSLAQLPFEGAEPTDVTIEQLTALAERLLREPGPRVSIEVDFELPDPEARTVMERRVEVVRAILLRRGIEPARLVVRAAGDGPMEPPATPSLVEPPD